MSGRPGFLLEPPSKKLGQPSHFPGRCSEFLDAPGRLPGVSG